MEGGGQLLLQMEVQALVRGRAGDSPGPMPSREKTAVLLASRAPLQWLDPCGLALRSLRDEPWAVPTHYSFSGAGSLHRGLSLSPSPSYFSSDLHSPGESLSGGAVLQ